MTPLRRRPPRRREPSPPLPEVRQEATLALAGHPDMPARVTRVTEQEIVLVSLLDVSRLLAPGKVTEAAIQFTGPRGVVRIAGRCRIEPPDVVRFEIAGAVEVEQRRDYVRVPVVRPVALAPVDDHGRQGQWVDTLTIDVSGNGFLASGPDTLAVGTTVRFRARLIEGEPPIEGVGRVARASDEGHRGIAIERLADAEQRRLVAFIFERQRIARKMTRERER